MINISPNNETLNTLNNNNNNNNVNSDLLIKPSSKYMFHFNKNEITDNLCELDENNYKFHGLEMEENYNNKINQGKIKQSKKFNIDYNEKEVKHQMSMECNVTESNKIDVYKFDDVIDYNGDNWYTNKKLLDSSKAFQLDKKEITNKNESPFDAHKIKQNSSNKGAKLNDTNGIFFLPTSPSTDDLCSEIETDDDDFFSNVQQCFAFQQKTNIMKPSLELQEQQKVLQGDVVVNTKKSREGKRLKDKHKINAQNKKKVSFNCVNKVKVYEDEEGKEISDPLKIEEVDNKHAATEEDKNSLTTINDNEKSAKDLLAAKVQNPDSLREAFAQIFGNQSHLTKILDNLTIKTKLYDERFRKPRMDDVSQTNINNNESLIVTETAEDEKQFLSADECVCRGKIICAPQKFTKYNTNITVKNCECPRNNANNQQNAPHPSNGDEIFNSLLKIQEELEIIKLNFVDRFVNHIDKDVKDKELLQYHVNNNHRSIEKLLNKWKFFEVIRHYEVKRIEHEIGGLKVKVDRLTTENNYYFKYVFKYLPFFGILILFGTAYYNYNCKN